MQNIRRMAKKNKISSIEIIDIDSNTELAEKYNITTVPTLIAGSKRISGLPEITEFLKTKHDNPE